MRFVYKDWGSLSVEFTVSENDYLSLMKFNDEFGKSYKLIRHENCISIIYKNGNPFKKAVSIAAVQGLIAELWFADLITEAQKRELELQYQAQYERLPHLGRKTYCYDVQLDKNNEANNSAQNNSEQITEEINHLEKLKNDPNNLDIIHEITPWLNYFKQKQIIADIKKTKESKEAELKIVKNKAKANPLLSCFYPGNYAVYDLIFLGYFQEISDVKAKEKLHDIISHVIQIKPEFKSLFVLLALWTSFGSHLRLRKKNVRKERTYFKIYEITSNNKEVNGTVEGFYNLSHTIFFKKMQTMLESNVFVHELMHAFFEFLLKRKPKDALAIKNFWRQVAEEFAKQVYHSHSDLNVLHYAYYPKEHWPDEMFARYFEMIFSYSEKKLLIDSEIIAVIETALTELAAEAESVNKELQDEIGIGLVPSLQAGLLNHSVITLTETECALLNKAREEKKAIIDIVIAQWRGEGRSSSEIIAELNKPVSVSSLLQAAVRVGDFALCLELLREPSLTKAQLLKAFNFACQFDHLAIAEMLLQFEFNPFAEKNRLNGLHFAVMNHNVLLINLLLHHKDHVITYDEFDMTPCHLAVLTGEADILDCFDKAYWNARDAYRQTPFHYAAASGNLEAVKFVLTQRYCDIKQVDINGNTILHLVMRNPSNFVLSYVITFPELELNRQNHAGCTPLYLAVKNKAFSKVGILMSQNADPNCATFYDYSPMMLATESGQEFMQKLLYRSGKINENQRDHLGRGLLHLAAKSNSVELLHRLIKVGGDINMIDNQGFTPTHYALMSESLDALKELLEDNNNNLMSFPDDVSLLQYAAFNCSLKCLNQLQAHSRIDFNALNKKMRTALGELLYQEKGLKKKEVVMFFLQKNCQIKVGVKDENGCNELFYVIKDELVGVFKALVRKGAYINEKNNADETPLFLAIKKNQLQIVRTIQEHCKITHEKIYKAYLLLVTAIKYSAHSLALLFKMGGDVNEVDLDTRETLMHVAIREKKLNVVRLLLEHGFDQFNFCNKQGKNVLDYAAMRDKEIFELLCLHVEKNQAVSYAMSHLAETKDTAYECSFK